MQSKIQLVDLGEQLEVIGRQVEVAIARVIANTSFIKGGELAAFEKKFAQLLGVNADSVVGVSSGTSALVGALAAEGIKAGDEVILPSHTFIATAEAVFAVGATPVFVDINAEDYLLDVERVQEAITENTKAIIAVHLYGSVCEMKKLASICATHNLTLIEDAAQSHLATTGGKSSGTIGDYGAFSFYPGKNLGAFGDAGAVIAKDPDQAQWIRAYVDHGRQSKYLHQFMGANYRLDALQAAVLSVKCDYLTEWTDARQNLAGCYDQILSAAGIKTIEPSSDTTCAYHLYVIEVSNRDAVIEHLSSNNISSGVHYPVPLHQQPAIKDIPHVSFDLSVTESICGRIVSLPMYPELGEERCRKIAEKVLEVAIP